jgi:hypothetical protein
MFLRVSRIPVATAVAAIAVAAPVALAHTSSSHAPTAAQVKKAVRTAERSNSLWATVNICGTKRHPHRMGVRGQIPALGFSAQLSMRISVQYYSKSKHRYLAAPGVNKSLAVGTKKTGVHQAGYMFQFSTPAHLRAMITFTWLRNGEVIGRTTKLTAPGIMHVDFSDPPGYSRATCTLR